MEQVKQGNESDQSDVIPENSVPVIISGLRDQCVKLASPFSLSVTVENADSVTWMLEQQVIEAEPEEGLVLRQDGTLFETSDIARKPALFRKWAIFIEFWAELGFFCDFLKIFTCIF